MRVCSSQMVALRVSRSLRDLGRAESLRALSESPLQFPLFCRLFESDLDQGEGGNDSTPVLHVHSDF